MNSQVWLLVTYTIRADFILTFVFIYGAAIREKLSEKIERRGRGRGLVHVADQFSSSKFPFRIRLLLDSLIRVRHHGDQKVDQYNQGHHHINTKCNFRHVDDPYRTLIGRGQTVRVYKTKQGEEE